MTCWSYGILLCNISNDNILLVNTLDDLKLFPLINYYTEDQIEVSSNKDNSILSIKNVLGRKQEEFKLLMNNNQYINVSGILIVHILKIIEVFIQFNKTS